MKNDPWLRFALAAGLMGWLGAASAAQEQIPWDTEVRKYNWRSLRFSDENGRPRTLWFHNRNYAGGETFPLYILNDPVQTAKGPKHWTKYKSTQLSAYEAIRQPDKERARPTVVVTRKGTSLAARVEDYLYDPPAFEARDSEYWVLVPRPVGEAEKPRPTPMAAFKSMPMYYPTMEYYERSWDPKTAGAEQLVGRRLLPMELLLARHHFVVEPDIVTFQYEWRNN